MRFFLFHRMCFPTVLHELCPRRERHRAIRAPELIGIHAGSHWRRGLGRHRVHLAGVFHQFSLSFEGHSAGATLELLTESKHHLNLGGDESLAYLDIRINQLSRIRLKEFCYGNSA
jgi:hypothetical protein